jgi:hypothetical protein
MPYIFEPANVDPSATPPSGNFVFEPGFQPSNPMDGMGVVERTRIGAGKAVADQGLGARTFMAQLQSRGVTDLLAQDPSAGFQTPTDTRAMGREWLDQLHGEAAQKAVTDKPIEDDRAGFWGNIGMKGMETLATVGGGLPGAFAANATLGALEPTTAEDSIAWNAFKGGLYGMGGQVAADGFGAILRGVKPTSEQIEAAQKFAGMYGGKLSRGQITGSELLQRIERMAASMGSKWSQKANEANSGAMKRAFDSVTGGDAGQMYKDLAPYKFTVDQQLANVTKDAGADYALLPAAQKPVQALDALQELFTGKAGTPNPSLAGLGPTARESAVKQGVPEAIGGEAPKLPVGKTIPFVGDRGDFNNFQALRSLYRGMAQGQTPEAAVYGKLADALDQAADRNLVQQGLGEDTMKSIRNAYSLEKVIRPAAIVDETGAVTGYNPTKVAAIVKQLETGRQAGRLDRMGEVGDMLRQAAAFGNVTKSVNSSGTAENAIAGKVVGLDMVKDAVGTALHGGNVLGSLAQGLAGVTGAVYAPRMINAVMQATRNGILPEATSAAGKAAADWIGHAGTAAMRSVPMVSLGALLGLNTSQ